MKSIAKTVLLITMTVGLAGAASNSLANGVYAVLAEGPARQDVQLQNIRHAVLVYDRKYSESDKNSPPAYVALDTSFFVPLILAAPPEMKKDGHRFALLNVTPARAHVKSLEKLTAAHLGGSTGIVIDGEIVTMHKVRSVIHDGKAQITRCGDNACETQRLKLVR
jgi:preprotein translocase subunit SecD